MRERLQVLHDKDWQHRWIINKKMPAVYLDYWLPNIKASWVSNQKATGQRFHYQRPAWIARRKTH